MEQPHLPPALVRITGLLLVGVLGVLLYCLS